MEQLRNRVLLAQRVDRAGTFEEIWSAIQGPWKLIERAGTRTLYHLASDPGELRDRASEEPSLVEALSASVSALRSSAADRPNATIEISIDRDRLEALRTLGYVEED